VKALVSLSVPAILVMVATGCDETRRQRLYPHFDVTRDQLVAMLDREPEPVREAVLARPRYFLAVLERVLDEPEDLFAVVDKQHGLSPEFVPPDLTELRDYRLLLNRGDIRLRRLVMPDVLAMNEAARIDGIDLVFSSGYRSYGYQAEVYARHVSQHGKEQADRESAEAGHSQHQLGTTIDFGSISDEFGVTPPGRWLLGNAWRFGFSLSYPAGMEELTGYRHENWHYRYITRAGTLMEREFFGGIQYHLLSFLARSRDAFAAARIGPSRSPSSVPYSSTPCLGSMAS
jgi:D-alanyl-D-alanine carboxypeptidase